VERPKLSPLLQTLTFLLVYLSSNVPFSLKLGWRFPRIHYTFPRTPLILFAPALFRVGMLAWTVLLLPFYQLKWFLKSEQAANVLESRLLSQASSSFPNGNGGGGCSLASACCNYQLRLPSPKATSASPSLLL